MNFSISGDLHSNSRTQASKMLPAIAAVTLYIIISCVVLEIARSIVKAVLPRSRSETLLNEFLCAMQGCVVTYERGIIRKNYGMTAWYMASVVTSVVYTYTFKGAYANPVSALDGYLRKNLGVRMLMMLIAVHLFGAFFATSYVQLTWMFGLSVSHLQNSRQITQCFSPINVPILYAILVEAALTFTYLNLLKFAPKNRDASRWYGAIVAMFVTVGGLGFTGGFFNPTLAACHVFGCKGVKLLDFMLIYWLGPLIGTYASHVIYPVFYDYLPSALSENYKRNYLGSSSGDDQRKFKYD